MTKRKGTSKTSIEKVRARLAGMRFGGGGFWKPKSGKNTVRILPGVGEMDPFFWKKVGVHYMQNRKHFICPKVTADEDCPICDMVSDLYATNDADSIELAKALRVKTQYWMNVIVRGNEGMGPQVLGAGPMIFQQISALVQDPDYGALIFDPDDGLDLTIDRSGDGIGTRYEVLSKRKETPLSDSDDQIDAWLDDARDLTPVLLTDDPTEDAELTEDNPVVVVYPYDRLQGMFEALDVEEEEEEEPEDEEEEEPEDEEDLETVIRRRRSSTRRRRR